MKIEKKMLLLIKQAFPKNFIGLGGTYDKFTRCVNALTIEIVSVDSSSIFRLPLTSGQGAIVSQPLRLTLWISAASSPAAQLITGVESSENLIGGPAEAVCHWI